MTPRLQRAIAIVHAAAFALAGAPLGAAEGLRVVPPPIDTQVLGPYVRDGLVDYAGLRADGRARATLDAYVARLASADTAGASRDEQLAFWINAYNLITLRRVLEAYPVSSITKIKPTLGVLPGAGVWKEPHRVAGATVTLDRIEHEILRGHFGDPRIHFAINCASRSCPPLWNRTYGALGLSAELDAAARRFILDERHNRIPAKGGRWRLSKIFEWYAGDFAAEAGSVEAYVARYLPPARVPPNGAPAAIEFLPYDWTLNEP